MTKKKKSTPQKTAEEIELLDKACEAERNFQKLLTWQLDFSQSEKWIWI